MKRLLCFFGLHDFVLMATGIDVGEHKPGDIWVVNHVYKCSRYGKLEVK